MGIGKLLEKEDVSLWTELASQICDLHSHTGPHLQKGLVLDSIFCYNNLEVFNIFFQFFSHVFLPTIFFYFIFIFPSGKCII